MAQIGDLVPRSGIYTEPGIVREKRPDGTVTVDTEPMQVSKYHKYTNTTGLTEGEKLEFNRILDDIYAKESDVERINDIQQEVDRLKQDPQSKNIVQYLRNQQAHLIRSARQLPQTYQWDEMALKK